VSLEDMLLRREIAIKIIENCKHLSADDTACAHCVYSAKIALEDE
jgi:hypothetical protein